MGSRYWNQKKRKKLTISISYHHFGEFFQNDGRPSNTITQITSHQQNLEQQLDTAVEEKRSLSQSLEGARVAIAKSESQRDGIVSRMTELKTTVEELKQENRDIRDHFEHYQQRTAEDRQQEREQFRLANQQLQGQVHDLTKHLTQAEARISEQDQECSQRQTIIEKKTAENHMLQKGAALKDMEIKSLAESLKASQTEHQALSRQNDELQEKLSLLTGQQLAHDKEVTLLGQSLAKVEAEWRETKDKVSLLADENKILLQEKAVIQGQFKQLQRSL